jgi:fructose-1,6-bisphosphatase/inositol monophosphatase family enzyme
MEKLLSGIFFALRKSILKGLSPKAIGVNNKGDVTKYFDRYCEKFIIGKLRASGLKAVIISEELPEPITINPQKKFPFYYCIIDPVDGSDNYLSGVPFVCLGIALFDENMEPVYSLAANYYTGDWFYADRKTLKLNGRKFIEKPVAKINGLIYFAFHNTSIKVDGVFNRLFLQGADKARSMGSTIGEIMTVIKGGAKSFIDIRDGLTPENFAPFFLIARHLRGAFTNEHGKEFKLRNLKLTETYNVIFSNTAEIHKKYVGMVKKVL